ncbi:MAG: hypothetical protein ACYTG6_14575 [Planctomycetota bacterium]
MASPSTPPRSEAPPVRPSPWRRKYVIEPRVQWTVTAQVVLPVLAVGLLYVFGAVVMLSGDTMSELSAESVRTFLLRASALFFGVAIVILTLVCIVLTHRFVGPAMVLRHAVEGMCNGEYQHRLRLRKSDQLKPLADALATLQTQLAEAEIARQEGLYTLGCHLDDGDLDGVRRALGRLQGITSVNAEGTAEKQPALQSSSTE